MWHRTICLEPSAIKDIERFKRWIDNILAPYWIRADRLTPAYESGEDKLNVRTDLIEIESMKIGGGTLSALKQKTLEELSTEPQYLISLYNILQNSLDCYGPVIYVGQSEKIRTRVFDHISLNSPLRKRLKLLDLSIEDMAFRYFPMPDSKKSEREILEQLLSVLLVAPLSLRIG